MFGFGKVRGFLTKHTLARGMIGYGILWPLSSITQEYLEYGKTITDADWPRAARFSIFGSICLAPLLHTWLKFTEPFFQPVTLKKAITRSALEQVTWGPFGLSYFLFGMGLLEKKPVETCINDVKEKFVPVYKRGVIYWSMAQITNFYWIKEKNRVFFLAIASFIWSVYMAHVYNEQPTASVSSTKLVPSTDENLCTDQNVLMSNVCLKFK